MSVFPESLPDDLTGPWIKAQRANHHLNNLKAILDNWGSQEPYEVRSDTDLETGDEILNLVTIRDVPAPAMAVVGDILGNMNAALDHLLCALLRRETEHGCEYTQFPIVKTSDSLDTAFRGPIKILPAEVKERIKKTKPYRGGDRYLWTIRQLCNIDKHRFLVAAGVGVSIFTQIQVPGVPFGVGFGPGPKRVKKGENIRIKKGSPNPYTSGRVKVEVVFDEPSVKGEPFGLTDFLTGATNRVADIVEMF